MFLKKILIKKIREKMKKMRDNYLKKIKSAKNEKNNLNAILRHNIKTPLLAQINSLELIFKKDSENLSDFQKEILKENLNSTCFLLKLVENIIFMLEMEKNNNEITENIDFSSEIKTCCKKVQNFAKEKQQEIVFKNFKDIKLNTNKKNIEKLLENILNVSILSGFENSKIELSLEEKDNKISFCAKNSSLFMSEEKIETLKNKENYDERDFFQLGMKLNYNVIEKLAKINNWNFSIKSQKDSCSFDLEILK